MSQLPAWTWDVFCRVIDNYGDIGVCWRLVRDLGARGHRVRLWLDDTAVLPALAPGALQGRFPGVQVLPWGDPFDMEILRGQPPAQVWVEAFGCELPQPFVATRRQHEAAWGRPTWINLEYLSAEDFPRRVHGLASPLGTGPATGWTKWFYYPGFDVATGGLLREQQLLHQQQAFDRLGWLRQQVGEANAQRRVSLFCYEPDALPALLRQLAAVPGGYDLLVTAGRASAAVRALAGAVPTPAIYHLPFLAQTDFDRLLWSCDLNFVRGEDSLVRALWAGQPFVWQPYPQDDGVHADKLAAFLDWLRAPQEVRELHRVWAGLDSAPLPQLARMDWRAWSACVRAARERLLQQPDLVTQLLEFIAQKR